MYMKYIMNNITFTGEETVSQTWRVSSLRTQQYWNQVCSQIFAFLMILDGFMHLLSDPQVRLIPESPDPVNYPFFSPQLHKFAISFWWPKFFSYNSEQIWEAAQVSHQTSSYRGLVKLWALWFSVVWSPTKWWGLWQFIHSSFSSQSPARWLHTPGLYTVSPFVRSRFPNLPRTFA